MTTLSNHWITFLRGVPLPTFREDVISRGQVRLVIGEPGCISAHQLAPRAQLAMVRAHPPTHPRASSNWLQPILAPTTPRTTSCEARTPQVAKMAPGAPLHSASGGAEEASLTWPNGPRGRSGDACCDAKGCSSSATQRRHAGSNCHPPVFFWNIPKGVKLVEHTLDDV